MTIVARLEAWELLQGRGKLPLAKRTDAFLLKACHGGRLRDGLAISLQVTPDEAIGPLTHVMGGAAQRLKVLDVRAGTSARSMELEVQYLLPDSLRDEPSARSERWEVEGVRGLVHNLNDLYRDVRDVRLAVVLGEWEDMLQVWALERRHLRELLEDGTLDFAANVNQLRSIVDG